MQVVLSFCSTLIGLQNSDSVESNQRYGDQRVQTYRESNNTGRCGDLLMFFAEAGCRDVQRIVTHCDYIKINRTVNSYQSTVIVNENICHQSSH